MNRSIVWFARNPVAANLLMVVILVAGALSLPQIRKETIPTISLDMITVSVVYPGASPAEVEEAICRRIEEKIHDLEGIRTITANASENSGSIRVEIISGYNPRKLLEEIKARVDSISSFPSAIEKPVISEVSIRNRVIDVVISGSADESTLKKLAEEVRDDLTEFPSITQVELVNVRPYEISIEVSEEALQQYELTFTEVAEAVKRSSLDVPGGVLKTDIGDVMLRTKSQAYWGEQFESILLRAQPDGGRITIGDVAQVRDGFQESDLEGKFNGKPGVMLSVYRVGDQSILEITDDIRNYIKRKQSQLPQGITLNEWQDRSRIFKSRMDLLVRNAILGLLLVFGILVLFLRMKLAFWVAVGIAISFMGTFWALPYFGGSINMISMFAFILVLGIVVDDAIIIGENIHSQHRKGITGIDASITGATDVAKPVVFAVLTSIVAFMPILFLPGTSGKLWVAIPIVVIATLVFSLLESLYILPAHLSRLESFKKSPNSLVNFLGDKQLMFSIAVERFVENVYQPFLTWTLKWRYSTMSFFLSILMIFSAILFGGWLKIVFFPKVEGDMIVAGVSFAQGTPVTTTREAIDKLELAAQEVKAELLLQSGSEEIKNFMTIQGSQPMSRTGERGSHVGEVAMELVPAEMRNISNPKIIQLWREKVGTLDAVKDLTFSSTLGSNGPGINIQLSGNQLDQLRASADQLKLKLHEYPGLYDIQDSYQAGKQEITLRLMAYGRDLGLNDDEMARQVRQGFYGEEVQRIQRGRDEVKVFVRFPEDQRKSLFAFENMLIRLNDGSKVPLQSVAEVHYQMGPSQIERIDRKRIIQIKAYVDSTKTTTGKVMQDLKQNFLDDLSHNFPDVTWDLSGRQKDQEELIDAMIRGFILAVLGIYALMAVPFRSYVQPLMVLSAIPFGLIGAILGHIILGLDISLLSLSGMIAVSGVVVNDNLVLVDYINRQRNAGIAVAKSIRIAGAARFRPIMLTSLTTFAGLTPLMLERSVQAQFLIPMAVALAFGVMFATLISLIMVPAAYHIIEDLKAVVEKLRGPVAQRSS